MRPILLLIAMCVAPAVASAQWGVHAVTTNSDYENLDGMWGIALSHGRVDGSSPGRELFLDYLNLNRRYLGTLCTGLVLPGMCTAEEIDERVTFVAPGIGLSLPLHETAAAAVKLGFALHLGVGRIAAHGNSTARNRTDTGVMLGLSAQASVRRLIPRSDVLAFELAVRGTMFDGIGPVAEDGYNAFHPSANIFDMRLGFVLLPRD